MKKQTYEIIGFKEIKICLLEPHPAAEMPIDEEDSFSIESSIQDNGIIQPLLVTNEQHKHSKSGQCHLILDGVNRWKKADALGLQSVPCLMVKCQDPRAVVLECLSTGRKRTTGQRIMAYLEQHKKDVLDAYEVNAEKGENYRKSSKRSSDRLDTTVIQDFSAISIAAKLHCSDKDVRAGIELLVELEAAKEPTKHQAIDEQRIRIYAGSSGIRRWRAAVGGRSTTKGKERKDPDYAQCTLPAATTLTNAFLNWSKIKWDENEYSRKGSTVVFTQISNMLRAMPESVRIKMSETIVSQWSDTEKKNLLSELKKSLKG